MTRAHAEEPGISREQLLIIAGVMAGIAVAALDSTVVGTAMPTIIGQLGGIDQYGWVFAAYLLTATTTVPIFATLADAHGRKPIFLIGLALFVGGSMLCGIAQSMFQLILFRALQGLGAGAVTPIAFTIVGDIFEPRQRAKMQGFFSSVWGVAAIVGPALGGIITGTVGWRWVFYINVPVGVVAAVLIGLTLHESFERRSHRLDWVGTVTLTGGVAALLLGVSEGSRIGFGEPSVIGLLIGALLLLVIFARNERTAAEPLIDPGLVRRPIVAAGLGIGTLAGVIMFGVTAYLPPVVQGVYGGSPLEAGIAVAAMSISWPIASIIAGRTMLTFGSRPIVLVGTAFLVVGGALLTVVTTFQSLWFAALGAAVVGLGMGLITTPVLVSIQTVVAWQQRGQATGLVQFSRTIGGAVGTGLMGAILASAVGPHASAILDPITRGDLPASTIDQTRAALSGGLTWIFAIMLVTSVLAWILAMRFMPAVHVGHDEQDPTDAPAATKASAARPTTR
jgi:EmrB/QacA subfamily drug resistance transporter